MSAGLELVVERGAALPSGRRVHEEPALLLCLATSIIALAPAGPASGTAKRVESALLDRSNVALVSARTPYRLEKKSPTIALLTLRIMPLARKRACTDYGPDVNERALADMLGECTLLLRTRWFDEVAQRYLFEREVCHHDDSRAARFLEAELTKEVFYQVKEKQAAKVRRSLVADQTELVRRALAMIEGDLFRPLRVSALARACHASESSLLRAFKKEVGTGPAAYQRDRRLDEAVLLLRGQQLGVAEVAMRVGYTNVPAFTTAFGKKFGAPPSALMGDAPKGVRLPPQGLVFHPPDLQRPARSRALEKRASRSIRRNRRRG